MAENTATVRVRLDEKLKTQAAEKLASMGLSVSEAVRLFLAQVVAESEPSFKLKVPNARTRAAIQEADELIRDRRARFATAEALIDDLEKSSCK